MDLPRFDRVSTQVLGISVDHVPCLQAWSDSLGGITYPLISDFYPHGEIAQRYGVFREDGKSERAIFVIDKRGVLRYVDVHDIDDQPNNEELFRELASIEGVPVPPPVDESSPEAPAGEKIKVLMYCTAWCPACRRARAFFREYGVPFDEVDVGRDREAAARLRELTGGNETTPTFDVNGDVVVNFQRMRLMELLDIRG